MQCPLCGASDHKVYLYKRCPLLVCPEAPKDEIVCYSPKRAELRKSKTFRITNIGDPDFEEWSNYRGE